MKIFKINFVLVLASLLIVSQCLIAQAADPTSYPPEAEEEFDSMEKWENWFVDAGFAAAHDCDGKIIWNQGELDNTYIPTALGKDNVGDLASGSHGGRTANYIASGIAIAATGGALALPIAGAQYAAMTNICASAYVLAPHEYVNRDLKDYVCSGGLGGDADHTNRFGNDYVKWYAPNSNTAGPRDYAAPLTKTDVPYYFHCDPTFDPVSGTNIDENGTDAHLIGRTLGYAGRASTLCNNPKLRPHLSEIKDHVNTITVEARYFSERFFTFGSWGIACNDDRTTTGPMKPGESKSAGITNYQAYYRLSPTGKVQICAAAPDTFLPIRIGCTATAAPGDESNVDEFLLNYVSDTRCTYLMFPRTDLQSLGTALPGGTSNPVKKFLQSDFHLTSTVVGCIKDMLSKIFIKTPNANNFAVKPFFQTFQERMTQIVYAALVLYLALVGIKIMSAGQPPQRHEAVMYIVKFALVVYFAIGNGFYEVENGRVTGLYPNMIQIPDELSNIFLQAQNINDPGGYCFLEYGGENVLTEREINRGELPGVVGTDGTRDNNQYVKMTVWDLVDCKIINYLTLGSCEYTLGGMMSVWFVSTALFVDKIGIVLAIVSLLYVIIVLQTMFKFTHIFILSMFTVTILVFLAPIFLIFALFDPLKQIFQAWMKMVLGYLIYPALLFAFVALMFATFDSIFYGNLNVTEARDANTGAIDYEVACAGIDSAFCATQKITGYRNNCEGGSSISQLLITQEQSESTGISYQQLRDDAAEAYRDVMLKMLLFAFLFYLFLDSVTEFMAAMLRIGGMGSISGLKSAAGPVGTIAAGGAAAAGRAATGGAARAAGGAVGAGAGAAARFGGAAKSGASGASAVRSAVTGKKS